MWGPVSCHVKAAIWMEENCISEKVSEGRGIRRFVGNYGKWVSDSDRLSQVLLLSWPEFVGKCSIAASMKLIIEMFKLFWLFYPNLEWDQRPTGSRICYVKSKHTITISYRMCTRYSNHRTANLSLVKLSAIEVSVLFSSLMHFLLNGTWSVSFHPRGHYLCY